MAKAKKFSPEQKFKIVIELLSNEKTIEQASREYHVKPPVLERWRRQVLENSTRIFAEESDEDRERLQERVKELERESEKLALHLEIAAKAKKMLKRLDDQA